MLNGAWSENIISCSTFSAVSIAVLDVWRVRYVLVLEVMWSVRFLSSPFSREGGDSYSVLCERVDETGNEKSDELNSILEFLWDRSGSKCRCFSGTCQTLRSLVVVRCDSSGFRSESHPNPVRHLYLLESWESSWMIVTGLTCSSRMACALHLSLAMKSLGGHCWTNPLTFSPVKETTRVVKLLVCKGNLLGSTCCSKNLCNIVMSDILTIVMMMCGWRRTIWSKKKSSVHLKREEPRTWSLCTYHTAQVKLEGKFMKLHWKSERYLLKKSRFLCFEALGLLYAKINNE